MKISDIRAFPTTIDSIPTGCKGVHESVLRSFQIVAKVRWLLEHGTPSDVVLSLMDEMEERYTEGS